MRRAKSSSLSIKVQFLEAFRYLRESHAYIWVVVGVFILSSVIGFIYSESFSFIDGILQRIINDTQGLSGFELVFFILQNNLKSAFLGLVLGMFFGIFSIINGIANGVVLGYVLKKAVDIGGVSVVWKLFPHGVFELPAIFIALALGIKLGMFIFASDPRKELKRRLYNSFNVFLMVIFPLLIIAAVIEGLLIGFLG